MSKASGFVLLGAGLAAAAYVLPLGRDTSDAIRLPYLNDAPSPTVVSEAAVVAPEPASSSAPPVPSPERPPMPSFSAPVVVTIAQRPSEPPASAPHKVGPSPRDRDAIGRELQKELRRVGCYEGELNGVWTQSTRQAMKAFTDRVNATLPTDEPDSILLTLVQAYQDRVCGKPCPAGQGLSDAGRCVPTAILARAAKKGTPVAVPAPAVEKPTPAITSWSTTTTAAAPAPPVPPVSPPLGTPPPEDRMALAGPMTAEPPQPAGAPTRAAAPPPAAPRSTKFEGSGGGGGWARNLFKHQPSLN